MQNQSKRKLLSTLNRKPLYRMHNSLLTVKETKCDLPTMKPTIARQRAKNQNVGAKAETRLNSQQKNPQMKRVRFLPNLSEKGLTTILPMKNPAKITDVDTNPSEPRLQTRSNCENIFQKERNVRNFLWRKVIAQGSPLSDLCVTRL